MFLIILLIVSLIFLISGAVSMNRYMNHTLNWKDYPSNEEYWSCFLWGCASLLLCFAGGSGTFFSIFLIVAEGI